MQPEQSRHKENFAKTTQKFWGVCGFVYVRECVCVFVCDIILCGLKGYVGSWVGQACMRPSGNRRKDEPMTPKLELCDRPCGVAQIRAIRFAIFCFWYS